MPQGKRLMKFQSNTITVLHTAFAESTKVGVRTIFEPVPVLSEPQDFAELSFELTNHPEPRPFKETTFGKCPSVSVGDVVVVTNEDGASFVFLCAPYGWTKMQEEELYKLFFEWCFSEQPCWRYWRDKSEA